MTEFDFTRGQKAFLMGMWGGSLLISLALIAWDRLTGVRR